MVPDGRRLRDAHAYAALTSLGSAQSYQKLEGAARWVKSWGNNTVQLGVQGGTDLGSNMPAYESFTLGGPLHLSGYRINEFAGREFWFARAMYYNKIFPLPDLLGSGVYLGASAETGRMSNRFDGLPSPGQLWSGSAFLGADTFVGPAFIGVGAAPAGRWTLVHAARGAVAPHARLGPECAHPPARLGRPIEGEARSSISRPAGGRRPIFSRLRPPRRRSSARPCSWLRRRPD